MCFMLLRTLVTSMLGGGGGVGLAESFGFVLGDGTGGGGPRKRGSSLVLWCVWVVAVVSFVAYPNRMQSER